MHEPDEALSPVSVGKPPASRACRIERDPTDPEYPPYVDECFRLREDELEQGSITLDHLGWEPSVERGRLVKMLDDTAIISRHAKSGKSIEASTACVAATGTCVGTRRR